MLLAVLARPPATAALAFPEFGRQVAQRCVFAQSPHNNDARELQDPFQKWPLGVAAIDHDPDHFPCFFQGENDPFDQSGRQLKLGGKAMPLPASGNRRHRLLANIEHRSQRQRYRTPLGMSKRQRNRDPDMAVQKG